MNKFCRPFMRFSTRVETEIKSVEGHKPPQYEDTVQGKYAGVLFRVASQKEALNQVLQDMKFIKQLGETSEPFRLFLSNVSFKRAQQRTVLQALTKDGFHESTQNLLETMIDNQRISFLVKTAEKYIEYYRILNKEENITIISAQELTAEEKTQVIASLKQQSPQANFQISYKVDPSILGGLQMYSGNQFLDLSLLSRVNKLRSELQKLSV